MSSNFSVIMMLPLLILSTIKYSNSANTCRISLVESIPQDLTYESTAYIVSPIWKVWEDLIRTSTKYININSLYWTMVSNDTDIKDNTSAIGNRIFWMIVNKSKSIPISINHDIQNATCYDMQILKNYKNIKINLINVSRLAGAGVQHSKMIIGDGKKAFVGSANMDWRSLTQIKEIGAYITNCPELVYDLNAFWSAINYLSGPNSQIPKVWPKSAWPKYNRTNPLIATVNGVPMELYTATSPNIFNPPHRTDDLTALLSTIKEAKTSLLISVMDFIPLTINFSTGGQKYWAIIEEAIITAAIDRQVDVKMLISLWSHTYKPNLLFLQSLAELGKKLNYGKQIKIAIKMFIVPAFNEFQRKLPFSRVNHSKYMVTDSTLYIGTSNWSGNYFTGTVGLSLIAKENSKCSKCCPKSIRASLEKIFYTDWDSIYAHEL